MNAVENLFLDGFRHAIEFRNAQERIVREIIRAINEAERKHENRLVIAASMLSNRDIQRLVTARFTGTAALDNLSKRIDEMLLAVQGALSQAIVPQLRDIAEYEAMFWHDRYSKLLEGEEFGDLAVKPALKRDARSSITKSAILGIALGASFTQYRQNRRARLRQAVVNAATTDGVSGLLKVFKKSQAARGRGEVIGGKIASIAGWSRSLVTHAEAQGAQSFVEANPAMDLIHVSIMDGHTSDECINRNGKFLNGFIIPNLPAPHLPPIHFGCRSYLLPWFDPSKITRSQRRRLSPETRRALRDGFPEIRTSTEAFNRMTRAQQLQILGPTRLKLFDEGKLEFPRDFIDPRTEQRFTLAQIARREGVDISLIPQQFRDEVTS